MKAFAVLSLKGGVGKTTVTLNLGAALGAAGRKVLLIDLDPQHDLTQSLGIDAFRIKGVEFLLEKDLKFEEVLHLYNENLHVLPAGKKLKKLELSLSNLFVKAKDSYFCNLLRNALEEKKDRYDYILIDCPPAGGFLTVNALTFAENVLIPVQCHYLGFESIKKTFSLISKIRRFNNPRVKAAAVIPVMHDARNKISGIIINRLKSSFNGTLSSSIIRVNVSLAEAPAFGKTIFDYKPDSRGAEDFRQLAAEILSKYA